MVPVTRPGGIGTMPMMARAVTLLPHPDSPITPSVWWRRTTKLTPSTARNSPSVSRNSTAQVAHLDEQVLGCPVTGSGGRHSRRC